MRTKISFIGMIAMFEACTTKIDENPNPPPELYKAPPDPPQFTPKDDVKDSGCDK